METEPAVEFVKENEILATFEIYNFKFEISNVAFTLENSHFRFSNRGFFLEA